MSLHDILMERAAIHFQNAGLGGNVLPPNDLWKNIGESVSQRLEEERLKREEERKLEENQKRSAQQIADLKRQGYNTEVSYKTGSDGTLIPSVSIKNLESEKPNKQIYVVNPTSKEIVKAGEVPSNSQVFQQPLDPESIKSREQAKIDVKRISEARKRNDEYVSNANQMFVALDNIERQAIDLGDFDRGVTNQIGARISTGLGKFSKDEKITRYEGTVAQELIPMARKLMEEKGPITEFDVARVEKGFGDLTTPLKDKIFLINQLRDKVKEAIALKKRESLNPGSSFDYLDEINQPIPSVLTGTALGINYTVEEE